MKVGFVRRFFAADWPMRLWFAAALAGVLVFVIRVYIPSAHPSGAFEIAVVAFVSIASIVAVILSAGILFSVIVGPFYRYVATANGAPFQPGDRVMILSGKMKGRVTDVYSLWQGLSVRVDLGEAEKESFKDVYGGYQLLRVESSPEPPN